MPALKIVKSVSIDAPVSAVLDVVSNFEKWVPWSPWLLMEPEAKVEVSDDKQYYSWDGDRVGAGNMALLNTETSGNTTTINYDLHFLKPWKSQSDVAFILKDEGASTKVSWTMDSSLPFFLFWMKKTIVSSVGLDYQRGLNMLKEYVEDGKISSKIAFEGKQQVDGCTYVGTTRGSTFEDIASNMQQAFADLHAYQAEHLQEVTGKPFCIYHRWNMTSGETEFTVALPVAKAPDHIPNDFALGNMPAHTVETVSHTGAYKYLGNAWSTLYTMERNKEFKQNKAVAPYEVFENSPENTAPNELLTKVRFPVKA